MKELEKNFDFLSFDSKAFRRQIRKDDLADRLNKQRKLASLTNLNVKTFKSLKTDPHVEVPFHLSIKELSSQNFDKQRCMKQMINSVDHQCPLIKDFFVVDQYNTKIKQPSKTINIIDSSARDRKLNISTKTLMELTNVKKSGIVPHLVPTLNFKELTSNSGNNPLNELSHHKGVPPILLTANNESTITKNIRNVYKVETGYRIGSTIRGGGFSKHRRTLNQASHSHMSLASFQKSILFDEQTNSCEVIKTDNRFKPSASERKLLKTTRNFQSYDKRDHLMPERSKAQGMLRSFKDSEHLKTDSTFAAEISRQTINLKESVANMFRNLRLKVPKSTQYRHHTLN